MNFVVWQTKDRREGQSNSTVFPFLCTQKDSCSPFQNSFLWISGFSNVEMFELSRYIWFHLCWFRNRRARLSVQSAIPQEWRFVLYPCFRLFGPRLKTPQNPQKSPEKALTPIHRKTLLFDGQTHRADCLFPVWVSHLFCIGNRDGNANNRFVRVEHNSLIPHPPPSWWSKTLLADFWRHAVEVTTLSFNVRPVCKNLKTYLQLQGMKNPSLLATRLLPIPRQVVRGKRK